MTAREAEQIRRTKARLRIIQHYEQRNVSLTCRFFGISRSKFYFWMTRYRKLGGPGLREYRRGPRISPHRIPPRGLGPALARRTAVRRQAALDVPGPLSPGVRVAPDDLPCPQGAPRAAGFPQAVSPRPSAPA
jgi:hypothetical protein